MNQLRIPLNRILSVLLVLAMVLGMGVCFSASAYETKQGVVAGASSLNVRSGPGKSYESIGYVAEGDTLTIVGEQADADGKVWYQIQFGDGTGYVSSSYITIVITPEAEPETPEEPVVPDVDFETAIAQFPESYRDDLREIHALYPNWVFVPVDTGTTWAAAVEAQTVLGKSLVATTSPSSWKSTQYGAYNWDTGKWVGLDGSSWVQASEEIIAYYMDPRSYLDETYIFAFLDYGSYDPAKQTVSGLASVMAGSFMAKEFTEGDTTYNYAEVLIDVAEETGMNPYVLSAMILIEIGSGGTSGSISGTVSGYEGYYNYYNIGAYAHSGRTAIQNGLLYAKGGSSGSNTSYNRPWNSRVKAMLGGAMYFKTNYVDKGQDTLYTKKFNVVEDGGGDLYKNQYMTNVQGVSLESKKLSGCFDEAAKAEALVFKIPVFRDMPQEESVRPTGDGSPNNKLASLSVEGYDLTPAFDTDTLNYELVVDSGVSTVTIAAEAKDSKAVITGIGTITLADGQNLLEVNVTAENGTVRTYQIEVAAEVDEETPPPEAPKEPTVTTDLTLDAATGYLRGLPAASLTDAELLGRIAVTDGAAQVLDKAGNPFTGTVGTGCVLRILNASGETWKDYTVVLYGDATGDGKINSVDLFKIQRHILKLDTLTGPWLAAADGTRDGKVNSVDLFKIQRHVLKLDVLAQ